MENKDYRHISAALIVISIISVIFYFLYPHLIPIFIFLGAYLVIGLAFLTYQIYIDSKNPNHKKNLPDLKILQLVYLLFVFILLLGVYFELNLSSRAIYDRNYPTELNLSAYKSSQLLPALKIFQQPILTYVSQYLPVLTGLGIASLAAYIYFLLPMFEFLIKISKEKRDTESNNFELFTIILFLIIILVPVFYLLIGTSRVGISDYAHYGIVNNLVSLAIANVSAFSASYPLQIVVLHDLDSNLTWNGTTTNLYKNTDTLLQKLNLEVGSDGGIIFYGILFAIFAIISYLGLKLLYEYPKIMPLYTTMLLILFLAIIVYTSGISLL